VAKRVGKARDERGLRPDHDELGVELAAEREQPFPVRRAHRVALTEAGDPRVARGRVQRL
jgi:hypothetical protein